MNIVIEIGDLTKYSVDAIVNPANERLVQGSGVDGVIHKKGGPHIALELRNFNGCKTGSTVVTRGYQLPARYVIHTPTPNKEMDNSAELLSKCFMNSLIKANQRDFQSIAFPSLGSGFGGGFEDVEVARIAVKSIFDFIRNNDKVSLKTIYLVLFSGSSERVFKKEFSSYSEA
ncbi:MAG: macro domain-containing protein [Candidatus Pacebacteria bacterium]|jgi:O-acetyl-ADP-ribose deacetylase (regulator of RNase III)|nr:macro domain-containing protein [Candidatus Paceibacterota bacterium]MBP9780776.1 macro domain-containing protein [Candidatus Paceibacterota bacterium]